jgi:hypothetical protein
LIQGSLRKRRLFFVFKAGDETSGHANHAGIATTDGYDFDFGFGPAVEAIDNLVYQIVSEGEGRFQGHELVFGFLETGADFFFVGIFEAEFVGAEMGEDFGGFKLPKLGWLGFGLQGVSVNVVKIFAVGQKLFGGGAFLPVEGRHLFGQESEQVVDDIRALRFPASMMVAMIRRQLTAQTFTILHGFTLPNNNTNSDGAIPLAGLIVSGNTMYGTANDGGNSGAGTGSAGTGSK